MVKINRIYTRSGDDGTTGLVGSKRTRKSSRRVCTYGEVDELNSFVGWARTLSEKNSSARLLHMLAGIQNELFDIGSILASEPGKEWPGMVHITPGHIERLEHWIDECSKDIPELRSFVLPGGSELNAALHVCRAVCRRVERQVWQLHETEKVDSNVLVYLNRLSDLFFAMARFESHSKGIAEYLWEPGKVVKDG